MLYVLKQNLPHVSHGAIQTGSFPALWISFSSTRHLHNLADISIYLFQKSSLWSWTKGTFAHRVCRSTFGSFSRRSFLTFKGGTVHTHESIACRERVYCNVRQYEFKQSDYEMADKLPFRSIVVSASQGGKGILIQNLVLKVYRGCFERIYIVSPTAHIDEAYREVIKYIEKDLKVDNKKWTAFIWRIWCSKSREDNRHTTQGNRVSENTGYEKTF